MANTKKDAAAVSLGRRGGKGRLRTMTKRERSESARHAAMVRHHGNRKPSVVWLVLDPVADNPPIALFSANDKRAAQAWARKNQPDGVIATLERRLFESGFKTLGTVHREYQPDTERQVKALKVLIEATEGSER